MRQTSDLKSEFKSAAHSAKRFLSTPKGKKYGLIALAAGVAATAAVLFVRARKNHKSAHNGAL